ncbi:MAG: hypothetical protein VKO44_08705 [Cyanobacteriota bacterium]|nr:hypothetical protein [Cyanobacteriota bacterium]
MDRSETTHPASTPNDPPSGEPSPSKEGAVAGQAGAEGELAHDFEAQKRIHQQIRNDPDYDDWEYGTEPLPHEAWATVRPQEHAPDESAAQA